MQSNKESGSGIGLSALWLLLAGTGFGVLYWSLAERIADETLLVQALTGVAWPFVVFAVSLPVVLILSANMARLIAIKKTLDEAPGKLVSAMEGVQQFSDNIEDIRTQISNDLNETLTGVEMRLSAVSEKVANFSRDNQQSDYQGATNRERLSEHNDAYASPLLTAALEKYNSDRRRTPLTINRGGGNRPQLVEQLRAAGVLADDQSLNQAIADYLTAVYTAVNNRRGEISPAIVQDLDSRKDELARRGAVKN